MKDFDYGKTVKKHKCKGCTNRSVGCHVTCETYNNIKKQNDEYRELVNKELDVLKNVAEFKRECIRKTLNRKRGVRNGNSVD